MAKAPTFNPHYFKTASVLTSTPAVDGEFAVTADGEIYRGKLDGTWQYLGQKKITAGTNQLLLAPSTKGEAPGTKATTDFLASPAASATTQLLVAPTTKGNAPTFLTVGTAANNIPQLNASGKLDSTILPAVAVVERVTTSTIATRNALTTVQNGDIVIVNADPTSTNNGTWMLINAAAMSNSDSWIKLVLPSGTIDVGQLPTSTTIDASTTTVPTTSAVNSGLANKQDRLTATGTTNLLTAPTVAGGQPGTKAISDLAAASDLITHAGLTTAHSATATPTASRLAMYNASSKLSSSNVVSGDADTIVANKKYVNDRISEDLTGFTPELKYHARAMERNFGMSSICHVVNTTYLGTHTQGIRRSDDSVTFTMLVAKGTPFHDLNRICSGDIAHGVAVGDSGKIVYNAGGESNGWTDWQTVIASGFGTSKINDVCYGAGKYVAVGAGGKLATSSDNGITWTQRTSGFGTTDIACVYYANGKFIAAGSSGKLATSTDGVTWQLRTTGMSAATITGVNYNPAGNIYIAVNTGGQIATSTNAETWSLVNTSSEISEVWFTGVCSNSGNTMIGFVGTSGPIYVAYGFITKNSNSYGVTVVSRDAVNWERHSIWPVKGTEEINRYFIDMCVPKTSNAVGQFVGVLSPGGVISSYDGISWGYFSETNFVHPGMSNLPARADHSHNIEQIVNGGCIVNRRDNSTLKFWAGTDTEYAAIAKVSGTIYHVVDASNKVTATYIY